MSKIKQAVGVLLLSILSLISIEKAEAGDQYFYAGVAPVYSFTNFDWRNLTTETTINNDTVTSTQAYLFLGYGVLLNRIYLGIEGGAQLGNRNASNSTTDPVLGDISNKISMNNGYVVDFRPGYVLSDKNTMIYGILGFTTVKFITHQEDDDGIVFNNSNRRNGMRFGAGYNLGLGRYFEARIEYAFTKYFGYQFSNTLPDGTVINTEEIDPNSHEISLGLAVICNI